MSMNIEKASKLITQWVEKLRDDIENNTARSALLYALLALEKQKSLPPDYKEWNCGFSRKYSCPTCGYELVDTASLPTWKLHPYCPECGQHLDWETRTKEDTLLFNPQVSRIREAEMNGHENEDK